MGQPVHWHNQCYDTPVFTSLGWADIYITAGVGLGQGHPVPYYLFEVCLKFYRVNSLTEKLHCNQISRHLFSVCFTVHTTCTSIIVFCEVHAFIYFLSMIS